MKTKLKYVGRCRTCTVTGVGNVEKNGTYEVDSKVADNLLELYPTEWEFVGTKKPWASADSATERRAAPKPKEE